MDNSLKSAYGTVRPYTRHSPACSLPPEDNSCRCSKWVYVFNAATKRKQRYSLTTPSWAEALRGASDILRGLDPEIAAARAIEEKKRVERVTVGDACDLWIERSKSKLGKDGSTLAQYRTLKAHLTAWSGKNSLNYIDEITTGQLQRWYQSADWTRLAATTRSQRWGVIRSMFNYWEKIEVLKSSPAKSIEAIKAGRGHVQGPYSDTQVKLILASIGKDVAPNLPTHLKGCYVPRLRVFIQLLLDTGCDVSDAIQYQPTQISRFRIDKKRTIHVFRYRRQKTGQEAVLPVREKLVQQLKSVPLEAGSDAAMPFRMRGLDLKMDQKRWSNRVLNVIRAAKVTHVELPDGIKKPANVKQFRHTAAVRWLREGQRVEEVAKMLGHVDTEMVRKHYAPWVKDLDLAHITRVVSVRQ
jgi:integrase